MEIVLTAQFEAAYGKLSATDKRSVRKAITLMGSNPRYPGLHVKKMEGHRSIWEARPSNRLRMTFEMTGDTITLRNVGGHDKVLKKP
jgi:mRNA-degrading endonuclease RelE of RelBE toxin-antitoxin system